MRKTSLGYCWLLINAALYCWYASVPTQRRAEQCIDYIGASDA